MCCVHMRMKKSKKKKKKICVHEYIFLRDERVRTYVTIIAAFAGVGVLSILWFINYVLLIFLFKQD
jgi:hypothetical protein